MEGLSWIDKVLVRKMGGERPGAPGPFVNEPAKLGELLVHDVIERAFGISVDLAERGTAS